ncbi:TPA: protein kinase family protein, partial [Campylobacter jejuni]|nr:protein kinase family protein [Campylobacter jejuni]
MKTDLVRNAIEIAYKAIDYKKTSAYIELYESICDKKLKIILSTLHSEIIKDFRAMNGRLPVTKTSENHYWASNSRNLKESIEIAKQLEKELKNSNLSFEIDEYYNQIFNKCLEFLQYSYGSELPEGMEKIKIYEVIPIFKKSDFIKNSKTNIEYQLENIGYGSYAKVFKYYDEFYQCDFALKRLNKKANTKETERFLKEFEIMKNINNPYILKVYSLNKDRNEYIMEYADFTLEKYINQNNSKLSSDEKISLGCQIIKGIEILWNKKILHRD